MSAPASPGRGRRSGAAHWASLTCAISALLLGAGGELYVRTLGSRAPEKVQDALRTRLRATQARMDRLRASLVTAASRVASLPETRAVLTGADRGALERLFARLDSVVAGRDDALAVAVHSAPLATLAWTGRGADLRGLETVPGYERGT
ncbi:MAG TPA: hypothetical protein VLI67_01700, partial [Vicinamibacteria bacterium]|nr:hypothetical protein [Vicinamibacteria bacterium]